MQHTYISFLYMIIYIYTYRRIYGTISVWGAQQFLPEFLIFARKVEYVWAMHFFLTWGGGGV